jgi:DNA-binding MarR family transcriptional regulator
MARSVLQAEIKKQHPFDSIEQEVALNLSRTHDVLTAGFSRLFKERGISPPLYNVLRILRGEGKPLPCLEVASRMITRLPDITRLVDRLEQMGYVARSRTEEDRRVVLLSITEPGLALLAGLDPLVTDLHRRQLNHLSPCELAELNRLIVKARRPESE